MGLLVGIGLLIICNIGCGTQPLMLVQTKLLLTQMNCVQILSFAKKKKKKKKKTRHNCLRGEALTRFFKRSVRFFSEVRCWHATVGF